MKVLLESRRRHLNEATAIPNEIKSQLAQAIIGSKFWEEPNTPEDIDEAEGPLDSLGTPATDALAASLNSAAEELGTDLYFDISSGEEEYTLGPDDPHGGYPNNWMMRGQYRGPYEELDGKHVVFLQFRPISEDFNFEDLNPEELAKKISTTLNHELVHYFQLKKQAQSKGLTDDEAFYAMKCDPKQVSPREFESDEEYRKLCGKEPEQHGGTEREVYLSRHGEIDAYAHEAAEQLLDKYTTEEALDAIRSMTPVDIEKYPEISSVVKDYGEVLKDKPEELNKFRKKLYQQIQRQGSLKELFISWRRTFV